MKSKDISYTHFKKYATDKDTSVKFIIDNYLIKTQSMFYYTGLPDTLPAGELEKILQTSGSCFITEVDGDIIALQGCYTGDRDVYGREKNYLVNNPYINLNKTFEIGKDGVIITNDSARLGLLPIIGMYAAMITDSKISLNLADTLTRMTLFISADSDNTKQSAELFLEKINNGELSVIGESAFFEGIKTHSGNGSNSVQITQLIELNQYHKANLMYELGLNANFNMKRERLNENEVGLNIDGLLPFTHTMLHCRREALKVINEKYNLNIEVDFHSAWKLEHETADKLLEAIDTPSEEETEEILITEEIEEIEEDEI